MNPERTVRPSRRRPFAFAFALTAAGSAVGARAVLAQADSSRWIATWAPSQQLVEPRNLPPAPGLAGSTLRQVLHVSIGGRQVRVRFSNAFGDSALTITAARLARSAGGSAIDSANDRPLRFRGADSVVIVPGAMATSDALDYDIAPLAALAVTVHFSAAPHDLTGHPGSRATSYLQAGDRVSASVLPDATTTEHWYVLAGMDVLADGAAAAVVALGNSITDGRGSGTDRNDRWPDNLARRLQADPRTRTVAVVNAGIGGNKILAGGLGPTALSRFDRDVLEVSGARWLIVLEGVNDIGGAREPGAARLVATDLIAAYRFIIDRAHARGLKVYGATITPFGGSFYDGDEREEARQTVNRWIRTGGAFDAVVDLDAVVRDPANPRRLLPAADTGDHLHPNEEGYRMMADAIDLGLFTH
jgi:lysophospholipase L1-like esterase